MRWISLGFCWSVLALVVAVGGCYSSTPVAPPPKAAAKGSNASAADSKVERPSSPVTVTTGLWSFQLTSDGSLVAVTSVSRVSASQEEISNLEKLNSEYSTKEGPDSGARLTIHADSWTVTFNPAGRLTAVELGPSGSDADLAELSRIASVERLTADKRTVTDKGLESVASFPALKTLDLTLSGITDAGLVPLAAARKLEDITLKRCDVTDEGYKSLAKIKTLKRIRAAQTNFDDKCLEAIAGMPQLELLDLQDCNRVSETGLASLKNFKKLKSLRLWGPTITDPVLGYISDARNLRSLSLEQSAVGPAGLAHIAGLSNLTDLKLYGASNVNADALEKIKGLTGLVTLDLRSTLANNRAMVHLTGLTSLKSLDLSESNVGDKGLAELKKLPELEDLNLWLSTATDAGLEHVGQMTNLKRLNLDKCKVTDAGLTHLAGLKKLEFLHLGNTQVTDAGLENLAGMKDLRELVVTFCPGVTPEGIKHLQEKLPELTKVSR